MDRIAQTGRRTTLIEGNMSPQSPDTLPSSKQSESACTSPDESNQHDAAVSELVRPTTPVVSRRSTLTQQEAFTRPERRTTLQPPTQWRPTFFVSRPAQNARSLGEVTQQVATALGCEASYVEKTAAALVGKDRPVNFETLLKATEKALIVAKVMRQTGASMSLVQEAVRQLRIEQSPITLSTLTQRIERIHYHEAVDRANAEG